MTGADIVFVVSSAVAATSGWLAVTRKNPIYTAVWMTLAMFAVATIFLLLHSSFLFVIQVLLYAGAILVLFVFVIMLLNPGPGDMDADRPPAWLRAAAAGFALVILALLAKALYTPEMNAVPAFSAADAPQPQPPNFGTTDWFGGTIYVKFLVAFEMISLLILSAIAAAVLLAKRKLEPDDERPDRPAPPAIEAKPPAPPAGAQQRELFETARH